MSAEEKAWYKNWPKDVPKKLKYPAIPLFELLRNSAKQHPEKTVVACLDWNLSYKDLDLLSDYFAGGLASLDVKKGARVAVFLPNIPQFVIAYYGVLKAGAVLTTISPLHREREVEYQLVDSQAETIIVLDSLYPIVEAVRERTKLKNVVVTGSGDFAQTPTAPDKSDTHSFKELLSQKSLETTKPSIKPAEDLAALQYTGGTTGTAKAAMLTHTNLVSNAVAFAAWLNCSTSDVFLTALPLFHIYGMTTSLNAAVAAAAEMVLLPRFDPQTALDTIQKYKVSVFCGVPTMYQTLLANPDLGKYDLTSIRACISGAAPLPPQVQKRFMEVTGGLLAEGYGLTEASPVTHCSPVDKTMQTVKIGSIGLPLPDTEALIVDAETGTKPLAVGETGELAVKGPQVMKGYWQKPEETAMVLRGGWLLTGDIARMDEDGYFYITDRKKDLVKYKGCSVYPREIEDVLYEHPDVRLCAVVGKPDLTAGEIVKAYVVLKEGASASERELAEFVNSKLAPYKAVREVELRKELPSSSAGKVLRRNLRDGETKALKRSQSI